MESSAGQDAKTDRQESKRARFVRLAEVRTSTGLEAIRKLGQLANPDRYEYTDADVEAIESAILAELETTLTALRERTMPTAAAFHLEG